MHENEFDAALPNMIKMIKRVHVIIKENPNIEKNISDTELFKKIEYIMKFLIRAFFIHNQLVQTTYKIPTLNKNVLSLRHPDTINNDDEFETHFFDLLIESAIASISGLIEKPKEEQKPLKRTFCCMF